MIPLTLWDRGPDRGPSIHLQKIQLTKKIGHSKLFSLGDHWIFFSKIFEIT